jgi:hypothetical protein
VVWELFSQPATPTLSPVRVKTGKAQNEQVFSGLPPKADPPTCALMSNDLDQTEMVRAVPRGLPGAANSSRTPPSRPRASPRSPCAGS